MIKTHFYTRLIVLIAITFTVQLIGLPQPITGPAVNFMLIMSVLLLNPSGAIILGCLTPVVASLKGQLPPALTAMVPFIIIGNSLLVTIFGLISTDARKDKPLQSVSHWIGLILGSVIKSIWIYSSARLLLPLLLGIQIPEQLIVILALPQFIAAMAGGAFALLIYQLLLKRYTRI